MPKIEFKELLDAGVHFGHLKRKWNPKMAPYIFMERKGLHVIDLNRTIECMETVGKALKQLEAEGLIALKYGALEVLDPQALSDWIDAARADHLAP